MFNRGRGLRSARQPAWGVRHRNRGAAGPRSLRRGVGRAARRSSAWAGPSCMPNGVQVGATEVVAARANRAVRQHAMGDCVSGKMASWGNDGKEGQRRARRPAPGCDAAGRLWAGVCGRKDRHGAPRRSDNGATPSVPCGRGVWAGQMRGQLSADEGRWMPTIRCTHTAKADELAHGCGISFPRTAPPARCRLPRADVIWEMFSGEKMLKKPAPPLSLRCFRL
jgi:hypothetical protein